MATDCDYKRGLRKGLRAGLGGVQMRPDQAGQPFTLLLPQDKLSAVVSSDDKPVAQLAAVLRRHWAQEGRRVGLKQGGAPERAVAARARPRQR